MARVVADTTPLRFLVEIGEEHLLPQIFRQIWIPEAVARELRHAHTLAMVREWSESLPAWVQVHEVANSQFDRELAGIDQGEWEAIELAKEMRADLLLIDDREGVRAARSQGLITTGTLGVLVEAARSGLIQIDQALTRLDETKFRKTPGLFAQAAKLARQPRS